VQPRLHSGLGYLDLLGKVRLDRNSKPLGIDTTRSGEEDGSGD